MKNSIKILILLCLAPCIPAMTMEQVNSEASENELINFEENSENPIGILMLPNELLEMILLKVYFDENACDGYEDIPDALDYIKQKLPNIPKNIRLVCRAFNLVNDSISRGSLSKKALKNFYRSLLLKKLSNCNCLKYRLLREFLKTGNDNGIISILTFGCLILDYKKIYQCDINKVIDMLLFYGANVNSKNNTGHTAVQNAIMFFGENNLGKEIINVLLAHGANVNLQNNYGDTALHSAISHYNHVLGPTMLEIIKILLDHGADLNIKNKAGDTPLAIAERGPYYELKKFLRSIDKNIEEPSPRTCILM